MEKNSSCCGPKQTKTRRSVDWLLWGSVGIISASIVSVLGASDFLSGFPPIYQFAMSCFTLLKTMAIGILTGILFIGLLSKMPRELVMSVLGSGKGITGIFRATLAGVLLDLCSHGILMVGSKLYERGASTGQVMAFLVASPWNSISLTIILASLIGVFWTLMFVALSFVIALVSGMIFNILENKGMILKNPNSVVTDESFQFWSSAKQSFRQATFNRQFFTDIAKHGIKESRIVIRWVFFGIIMASALRSVFDMDQYQLLFGPTLLGLGMTLIVSTVLEVCSEGSTPIAADIFTRAHAPGNSFCFLMSGVSTDYTEIMVIKDTTKSWKVAFLLPIVTLPQIILVSLILNLA